MINRHELDDFTSAYIECALWAEQEAIEEEIQNGATIDHLADSAIEKMKADCLAFQEENKNLLTAAYDAPGYDEAQAGHDFWLTRNGHGAGFWDRGLEDIGQALSDKCGHGTKYSTVHLFVSDNTIHHERG